MDNGSLSSRGGQPQNTLLCGIYLPLSSTCVTHSSNSLENVTPFKETQLWNCNFTQQPKKKKKRKEKTMNISPFEIYTNASLRDRNKGHTMYVTGENKKTSTTIRLLGPQWDPNYLSSFKSNLYPSSTNSNPVCCPIPQTDWLLFGNTMYTPLTSCLWYVNFDHCFINPKKVIHKMRSKWSIPLDESISDTSSPKLSK